MCSFAGCNDPRSSTEKVALEAVARRMAEVLRHRGPDDQGVWADSRGGVALGHRRLSILDLSTAGHQLMFSHMGCLGLYPSNYKSVTLVR
jgi:asparagine synthase (glutamine-hydrolysing)